MAHYMEQEGVPTTQISLVREHTEVIKPPRALWVPFELGRPLGVPGAPAFQKRVLLESLKLLEEPYGPILRDFTEDAPLTKEQVTILACPVSFRQEKTAANETEQLYLDLKNEIMSLLPWYQLSLKRRGRTTVGVSGIEITEIDNFICSFLQGKIPANPHDDIPLPYALKLTADDLKAYYYEAMTAQPGQELPSSKSFSDWFWDQTAAGKVLLAVREICIASDDRLMQSISRLIVPIHVMSGKQG